MRSKRSSRATSLRVQVQVSVPCLFCLAVEADLDKSPEAQKLKDRYRCDS